jgi:hypothetical protein
MKASGTNITHKLIDISLLMTTFLLVPLDVIVSRPAIMRYFISRAFASWLRVLRNTHHALTCTMEFYGTPTHVRIFKKTTEEQLFRFSR